MNKVLVSYFSASGVTKNVTMKIAGFIGADLFEIEPTDKYSMEDLNWNNKESRSSLEMNDNNARPSIKNIDFDIDNYDTILIGFPIWWGVAPRIINTFLESVNFTDKNIILFCTSGGSSMGYAENDLKNKYPNYNFKKARRLNGSESKDDILDFVSIT